MSISNAVQPLRRSFNWPQFGRNGLLLGSWLWLFAPIFPYLRTIFSRQDFRTNQIVLLAIIVLFVLQMRRNGVNFVPDGRLNLHRWPLTLVVASATLFWLSERWLDINVLSATLFVLGSYGLVGLWLNPVRWRSGLPVALLLAGTLPIYSHIQTFIGYPLRIGTAAIVRDGLARFGVGSVGIDTIMVLENGMTHIDVPCSGVNSLWTGGMFLLATTWIEGKRLSWRWAGILLLLLVSLVSANLLRVAVLVVTGTVWSMPVVADMLHLPMGMLGFAGSGALALLLLRRLPTPAAAIRPSRAIGTPLTRQLPLALAGLCAILALSYQSSMRDSVLQPAPAWPFTAMFHTTPDPLESEAWHWLEQDGAKSAERLTFTYGDLSGSLLFVVSNNWHAHHNPERCFLGGGLQTASSDTLLLDADFPVRRLQLNTPLGDQRSAAYWFQSRFRTTDDYATRIWADVRLQRQEWVLVTIFFNQSVDWHAAETQQMLRDLHKSVGMTQ